MYGEQRTLSGLNAALCRFAMTGHADTGVIVEYDSGDVWCRVCAVLGLSFTEEQGTPASKVHDLRGYMLYASADLQRLTLRTLLQVHPNRTL